MKNRSVGKYCSIACVLTASLTTNLVLADWSAPQQQGYKRQGFGDFPPKDIDKLIEEENRKNSALQTATPPQNSTSEAVQPPADNTAGTSNNPAVPAQVPITQYNQIPNYGSYPAPGYGDYNRGGNYAPWGNRGSGFTTPWGNNGSSFSGPWNNNRGSGFSMPWGNNGSGFSGPWNNNGSSFTGPWNNDGSGAGPLGN